MYKSCHTFHPHSRMCWEYPYPPRLFVHKFAPTCLIPLSRIIKSEGSLNISKLSKSFRNQVKELPASQPVTTSCLCSPRNDDDDNDCLNIKAPEADWVIGSLISPGFSVFSVYHVQGWKDRRKLWRIPRGGWFRRPADWKCCSRRIVCFSGHTVRTEGWSWNRRICGRR